ncbi:MAG: 50S ribosomal protein L13 [bacterium]|nr:50S ribosomal protein L13 [bacterium]
METHILDASKEPLGRLATKAAVFLMGKHRADFAKHIKQPVRVIVTEADRLVFTGRKWQKKLYRRHSGYIGHLREFTAEEMRARDSRLIVRRAVLGMLPKNKLRSALDKKLVIYKGQAPESKS